MKKILCSVATLMTLSAYASEEGYNAMFNAIRNADANQTKGLMMQYQYPNNERAQFIDLANGLFKYAKKRIRFWHYIAKLAKKGKPVGRLLGMIAGTGAGAIAGVAYFSKKYSEPGSGDFAPLAFIGGAAVGAPIGAVSGQITAKTIELFAKEKKRYFKNRKHNLEEIIDLFANNTPNR